jgi:hypothetical protein
MITESDNRRLTSVMIGTPGGELLRRYWYPIASAGEMRDVFGALKVTRRFIRPMVEKRRDLRFP